MNRLFLDTEFTDFAKPELISLALVPKAHGQPYFYAERSATKPDQCSDFVQKVVLPALTGPAVADDLFADALYDFLGGLRGDIEIVCTWPTDAQLLYAALTYFGQNKRQRIPDMTIRFATVKVQGKPKHNALDDAKALRAMFGGSLVIEPATAARLQ